MIIRPATAADPGAIEAVLAAAFPDGGQTEIAIVAGVRAEGAAAVELVAQDGGRIVGCVLFSAMRCEPDARIVGLGPLAVAPYRQGQGVGAALTRAGLEACRASGWRGAVVLGHPDYYPRFGFSAALAAPLRSVYAGLAAFMAMPLTPGGLQGVEAVAYPKAFG